MPALSRRRFVGALTGLAGGAVLMACSSAPPAPTSVPPTQASAPPTPAPAPTQAAAPTLAPTAAPAPTQAPAPTVAPVPTATAAPAATPSASNASTLTARFLGDTNPWTTTEHTYMPSMIFSRLVERKADYTTIVPALADTWKVSDDGLSYTFNLRKDVKWHDGQPFTAADVVWSYQTLMHPDMGGWLPAYSVLPIKGANDYHTKKATDIPGLKAPDDYTVQITTEAPTATLLGGLSCAWILPKHLLEKIPVANLSKDPFFTTKLVGTGAYKFKEFVQDQFLTVTANESYFRGAPKIGTIIAKGGDDEAVNILSQQRGEIDVIGVLAPDNVERVKADNKLQVWPGTAMLVNSFSVNFQKPYFADKRARQALVYALDRKTIVDKLWKGAAKIVNSPILVSWVDQSEINQYAYDPAKAKQLLQAVNWPANQSIELMVYYTDEFNGKLAAAFQQYWSEVGIKSTIRQSDYSNLQPDYDAGKFDLMYQGGSGGSDPNDIAIYFSSKSSYNKTIRNADLDKLFDQGLATIDQSKRAPIYQKVSTILNDEDWWPHLWAPLRFWSATSRVQNVKNNLPMFRYHPAVYQAEETWTLAQ